MDIISFINSLLGIMLIISSVLLIISSFKKIIKNESIKKIVSFNIIQVIVFTIYILMQFFDILDFAYGTFRIFVLVIILVYLGKLLTTDEI